MLSIFLMTFVCFILPMIQTLQNLSGGDYVSSLYFKFTLFGFYSKEPLAGWSDQWCILSQFLFLIKHKTAMVRVSDWLNWFSAFDQWWDDCSKTSYMEPSQFVQLKCIYWSKTIWPIESWSGLIELDVAKDRPMESAWLLCSVKRRKLIQYL